MLEVRGTQDEPVDREEWKIFYVDVCGRYIIKVISKNLFTMVYMRGMRTATKGFAFIWLGLKLYYHYNNR